MPSTIPFKSIKNTIKYFLEQKEILKSVEIHLIEQTKFDLIDGFELIIYLTRPGILIGKGGETIDELTKILTDDFKLPFQITLKEFDPFS